MAHSTEVWSKENKKWNANKASFWVGGHFVAPNLSSGYHAIQTQWWEHYVSTKEKKLVLLVSETSETKEHFQKLYPNWIFENIDFFPEIAAKQTVKCDVFGDICAEKNPLESKRYDLILNQATLEHVYNPFGAMKNLFESLVVGGTIVSHTHPPAFPYHSYPRDYFRFMKDWWYDLPKHFPHVELQEFYMDNNEHVFSCYRRTKI